jgi:ABC-type protease/lipase transport system fused ATPase/permease subunit
VKEFVLEAARINDVTDMDRLNEGYQSEDGEAQKYEEKRLVKLWI